MKDLGDLMLKYPIPGINNVETSSSRSGGISREIQILRHDMKKHKMDLITNLKDTSGEDSPYASDRKTIDKNKIHQSPREADWRHVSSDNGRDAQLELSAQNLKKLNIV